MENEVGVKQYNDLYVKIVFTWFICKQCYWKKTVLMYFESLMSSQPLICIKNWLLYRLDCLDGFDKVKHMVAWEA